jgi:hypothetical protein
MDTFEFIVAVAGILIAGGVFSLSAYLIFGGRLDGLQKVPARIEPEVKETFGIKELTTDEILSFANFVFRDFQTMERGAGLAHVQVFVEKGLIIAKHVNGFLQIELTEKGQKIHDMINAECEKRLMVAPKTEMMWKTVQPKPAKTMLEKLESRMNIR